MGNDALDKFGAFLMKNLRDAAIDHYDGLAVGHWKAPAFQKLQKALENLTERQRNIVRQCVIQSLDHGLHDFLFALQENFETDNTIGIVVDGKPIAEDSDGLHGELFSEKGWKATFSKHGEPPDQI